MKIALTPRQENSCFEQNHVTVQDGGFFFFMNTLHSLLSVTSSSTTDLKMTLGRLISFEVDAVSDHSGLVFSFFLFQGGLLHNKNN